MDSHQHQSVSSPGRMSRRVLSRDASSRVGDSISLSMDLMEELLSDADGSIAARAGDVGDCLDIGEYFVDQDDETVVEKGVVVVHGETVEKAVVVAPIINAVSPLPMELIMQMGEKNQVQMAPAESLKAKEEDELPFLLSYMSYLVHLSVFGILGVLTRYLLQTLFGPAQLALTGGNSPLLYLDLVSNILGSFLMGWFGIIFRADIRDISDQLVVGMTTGYLGSVSTLSAWNMRMLDLSVNFRWAFAIAGIVLGLTMINESTRFAVECGDALRRRLFKQKSIPKALRVRSRRQHIAVMTVMLLLLGALWSQSVALAISNLDSARNGAFLWLACSVAPPGVWVRWHLARLNGRGLGKHGILKWLPIGTLTANILSCCLMAGLSTISKAVNTERSTIIVRGIQFGFNGCLSTVTTFAAEVLAMRQSGQIGRAVIYMALTMVSPFLLGMLIYSVPVWVNEYN